MKKITWNYHIVVIIIIIVIVSNRKRNSLSILPKTVVSERMIPIYEKWLLDFNYLYLFNLIILLSIDVF